MLFENNARKFKLKTSKTIMHSINLSGYLYSCRCVNKTSWPVEGYRYPHFLDWGVPYPHFQDQNVKICCYPKRRPAEIKLYNKTIFGPGPPCKSPWRYPIWTQIRMGIWGSPLPHFPPLSSHNPVTPHSPSELVPTLFRPKLRPWP